jgi:hypothetical protein
MVKFFSIIGVLLMLVAVASYAAKDEATVKAIWNFDEGDAADSSGNDVNGTLVGEPEVVDGIVGKALRFDGVDDGVKLPDEEGLNTGGPFTNRTIAAYFKCDDVSIPEQKQTIFEEGGRSRGLVLYVFESKVYVAAWNRAEYNWVGAWPSAAVESNKWYHVALVLRDGINVVEDNKFEMWLNGEMVASEPGGQVFGHGADIGIAYTNGDTLFHDEDGVGTNMHFLGGIIDEVIVYNSAFDEADFAEVVASVEPQGKYTTTWGALKTQRTKR